LRDRPGGDLWRVSELSPLARAMPRASAHALGPGMPENARGQSALCDRSKAACLRFDPFLRNARGDGASKWINVFETNPSIDTIEIGSSRQARQHIRGPLKLENEPRAVLVTRAFVKCA